MEIRYVLLFKGDLMKKFLRALQYFFAAVAMIYTILIFVDEEIATPMTVCAIIFWLTSLLLFIRHKKGKLLKRKNLHNKDKSVINVDEQAHSSLDTRSDNISVKRVYAFPKYSNENTDTAADEYILDENGRCVGRADGQPLNDADCAYMVRNGYEQAKRAEQQSSNPKFHRTADEKEMEFQFADKHGAKSQKICDVFLELADRAYQTDDFEEKIVLLQRCIEAYNTAKKWHYQESDGARIWFQDNWEYCHNSQNECFCWVDGMIRHRDYVIKMHDVIIPWILERAENGFLQTDIYRAFPDEDKTALRNTIASLASCNQVQKTKKGNTYFVHKSNAGGVQNE